MNVTRLILAATLAACTASSAMAKDWKTVTITTEAAYAPWNLTNPDGTIGGFEPELISSVCKAAKLECKFVASDWDSMIASVNAGKFDVIMDALSITDDRKKVIAFTVPYASTPASFAVMKDSPLAKLASTGTVIKLATTKAAAADIDPLRALLKGKTIGIQAATVYAPFVYDNFKDIASVKEYKTPAERDLDLVAGRIDAAFDDATYFQTAFQSKDNADMTLAGPQIAGPVWGEGEGLGLRQSDPELKAIFDAAIKAAIADGTVKTLSEKWFKINVSP